MTCSVVSGLFVVEQHLLDPITYIVLNDEYLADISEHTSILNHSVQVYRAIFKNVPEERVDRSKTSVLGGLISAVSGDQSGSNGGVLLTFNPIGNELCVLERFGNWEGVGIELLSTKF